MTEEPTDEEPTDEEPTDEEITEEPTVEEITEEITEERLKEVAQMFRDFFVKASNQNELHALLYLEENLQSSYEKIFSICFEKYTISEFKPKYILFKNIINRTRERAQIKLSRWWIPICYQLKNDQGEYRMAVRGWKELNLYGESIEL